MGCVRRAFVVVGSWYGPLVRYRFSLALSVVAAVAAGTVLVTARRPDHAVPGCAAPDERVVEVEPGCGPRSPTPPGVRFTVGGGHHGISHLRVGGQTFPVPWEMEEYGLEIDWTAQCSLAGEAPLAITTSHTWSGGSHSEDSTSCEVVPEWLVSKGLVMGAGDVVIMMRSVTTTSRTTFLSFTDGHEHTESVVVARGPDPFWRFAVIEDLGDVAPAPRLDGDEIVLCFPDGEYRLPGDTMADGRFVRWPRRLAASFSPGWSWSAALAALLACGLVGLWRARAARRLAGQLRSAPVREAVVTGATNDVLELLVAGGDTPALKWHRVIDVFRGGWSLCLLADPGLGLAPGRDGEVWEPGHGVAGQRVAVVIEPRAAARGPYRAAGGSSDTWAWVLHGGVKRTEAIRLVNRLALPRLATWLALALAAGAAFAACYELWWT